MLSTSCAPPRGAVAAGPAGIGSLQPGTDAAGQERCATAASAAAANRATALRC